MSYFKKFCDLIGGIGAFFLSLFLLGQYLEYNPSEIPEGKSKLQLFFSSENGIEYRQYLIFIVSLYAAIIFGRLLKRFPAVTFYYSILPLCQVMAMLFRDRLYTNAVFYIIICVVLLVGNLYEAVSHDKKHGTNQLWLSSIIAGGFATQTALLSIKFSSMAEFYSENFLANVLSEEQKLVEERLSFFGVDLISNVPEEEINKLVFIVVALALCLVATVFSKRLKVLRLLSFVLAAVPFVCTVAALHTETLTTSPMLVLVPVTVCFLSSAVLISVKD